MTGPGRGPADGLVPDPGGAPDRDLSDPAVEDDAAELYDDVPCGHLSTLPDGRIIKINRTLLDWLGHPRADVVGRRRLSDLLTVGGRLYLETHLEPLLRMHGQVNGIALELRTASGERLPVLLTAKVKADDSGRPRLFRMTVFDARERRAYEQELLRARREAEHQRDRVHRLATTLQRTLLPPSLAVVPGLEVAAHYHPASADEVGGDFYDLFPLADDEWGLFLGDVCGKGAEAAAVTSLARYTLRAAAVYDPDPVAVLTNLNAVLCQELTDGHRFCTVLFGLLRRDAAGYRLTLAGGGHPPALLLRGTGSTTYLRLPGGQLIGVLAEARIATVTVRLQPGDTVALYTDGLLDARTGADGSRYEQEGLYEFAAALAPTTAPAFVHAVADLLAGFGAAVEDDTAVLALSVP